MLENIGGGEILLILIVILVFFGPKKIPELAASLGKGLRKFNEAKDGFETQIKTVMKEPLDAINDAKAGFEAKVLEASQPLRETFLPPASLSASTASLPAAATSPVIPNPVVTATPVVGEAVAQSATPGVDSQSVASAIVEPNPILHVPAKEA